MHVIRRKTLFIIAGNSYISEAYRERKIQDMTLRLDGLYEVIIDLENRIEDARLRRAAIETEAISLKNLFRIMKNFGELYDITEKGSVCAPEIIF
ncbi:hypothetical protein [Lachnoclostridium sp. Marseille-P6806]|uniref:hypothetical protein n=1 Tax=Lachnoclostridium sp. Marseille-P6806 TaxID=2364793 RepID=UPI001A910EF4|nr:hypothetical protein [Lachnoclostridium sp. Marseille-P6806]